MLSGLRGHARRHAIGYVALFVALGGVSYAAIELPAGSVDTKQLANGGVTERKLAKPVRTKLNHPGPRGVRGPTGPAGPAGAEGRIGPTGPPGIPYGPPPVERLTPLGVNAQDSGGANPGFTNSTLVSVSFTNSDGKAHRVLLTGGLSAICDPCADAITNGPRVAFFLTRAPDDDLVVRRLGRMANTVLPETGSGFSEIVVTPDVCGPCTFSLRASVGPAPLVSNGAGGSTTQTIAFSQSRLGLLDLGPVVTG